MGRLFDIQCYKSEKRVFRDNDGMFQTIDGMFSLTEKDVPEEEVKVRAVELQKQVKIYLSNMQMLDGVKSLDQVKAEVAPYTDMVIKVKEAVKNLELAKKLKEEEK